MHTRYFLGNIAKNASTQYPIISAKYFDKNDCPVLKFRILDNTPITYRLRDKKDVEILGSFYDYELPKVINTGMYQIDKILRTCIHRGKRQVLVRWLGYNSDFDSWISVEEVHNTQ